MELGFGAVSRSSEVAPLIKLVSRAETTTLDAYLNPILAGYVARVWSQFGGRAELSDQADDEQRQPRFPHFVSRT